MTAPEPSKKPGWRPQGFELADPTAAPDPGWTPGPLERLIRRTMRAARPWMAVPAVLAALAVSAVIPVPAVIEHPGDVLDVAAVVQVRAPSDSPREPGHSGTYLTPRREASVTALDWLVAVLLPGRAVVAPEPVAVFGLEPVESALLMGAGIAPGRADADALGLAATFAGAEVPRASLAVSLEIFDSVSTTDLSRGRRVLVLGALAADGTLTCGADPAASVRAADPPVDLVLLGADCPVGGFGDAAGDALIRPVPSLPDALVQLSAE